MSIQKASRFGWLERANILVMAAEVRRHYPEYPAVTANLLSELSDEEIHRIFEQLNNLMRSIGQMK